MTVAVEKQSSVEKKPFPRRSPMEMKISIIEVLAFADQGTLSKYQIIKRSNIPYKKLGPLLDGLINQDFVELARKDEELFRIKKSGFEILAEFNNFKKNLGAPEDNLPSNSQEIPIVKETSDFSGIIRKLVASDELQRISDVDIAMSILRVISLATIDPNMKKTKISRYAGIQYEVVIFHLSNLMAKGLVKAIGSDNNVYNITESGSKRLVEYYSLMQRAGLSPFKRE